MTIIVEIDKNGKYLFDSIKGIGGSEEDKKKAIQLNEIVKKRLIQLTSRLKNLRIVVGNRTRNKVEAYWEFGLTLRKIFLESGLVEPSEKKLFWLNVGIHAPEGLLAKDRGPNRIHVAYCFRLAGYPKKIALKRKWSEWVYLFDSPFINYEERFDSWDKEKIETEQNYTSRENTRLFIQCLNSILSGVETKDLNDEEIVRCYDGSLKLSKKLITGDYQNDSDNFKIMLKKVISDEINSIGKLIDGSITSEELAKVITSKI
ncbi:hypothetical protein GOV04_02680 [Candidatus Woesearchaeota archaeon]|nr:hypothetical protein [Candidatus Woesearchaeota archaeon]